MDQIWEACWNPVSLLGYKEHHCAVTEAPTQHGMVFTSPPNIFRVFDNLHMLWMGTWNSHQVVITTSGCLDLGSQLKSWFSAGLQRTPLCSGWGSNPTWNGSHTPSQHIYGLWQPLYDVDGHMNLSSCHYHNMWLLRYGESAEFPSHCYWPLLTAPSCSGRGWNPTWDSLQFPSHHMKGVW